MRRLSSWSLLLALLPASALAAEPRVTAEKTADARDKMICKRFLETGSLVKGYRTCKTKWEWERERTNLRNLTPAASCGAESGQC